MRIFRLSFDSAYRSLKLADPSLLDTPALQFDSTSRVENWVALDLVLKDEKDSSKPEPDIWQIHGLPMAFAYSASIADDPAIEWACCEQLPINFGNRPFILGNATEQSCYDALDVARCEWPSGVPGVSVPSKYAFYKRSNGLPIVGSPTIFTVPETCALELYVYEYDSNPDEEFKAKVEDEGLTGLCFEEIWNDEEVVTS